MRGGKGERKGSGGKEKKRRNEKSCPRPWAALYKFYSDVYFVFFSCYLCGYAVNKRLFDRSID